MKRTLRRVLVGLALLLLLAVVAGWTWWMMPRYQADSLTRYGLFRALWADGKLVPQPLPEALQAGVGAVDITPRRPVPLAGYGARHGRLAQGVHDRIFAKALVLDNGSTRVAIITMDQIGTSLGLKRKVLARVGRQLGLDEDRLLICASHTHSATGAAAKSALAQLATGRYDSRVEAELVRNVSTCLTRAGADLAPARLGWAQALAPAYVANRRGEEGDTFTDPLVNVLRIDDPKGKVRALLVNYSAHGTCLPSENMLVSGDWPGYLQRELERVFPGSKALFANGAEGDQAPRGREGLSGFPEAEYVGTGVAAVAGQAALRTTTRAQVPLAGAAMRVRLPVSALGMLVGRTSQVQALGIGEMALVGVPGEMTAEVGSQIRQQVWRLGFPRTGMVGLANDHLGYIPSARQYRAGGYERQISFYGPGLAKLISAYCENAAMALAVRMAYTPRPERFGARMRLCGAGQYYEREGQRVLHLRGNPYELGYQQGALMRSQIERAVRQFPALVGKEMGLGPTAARLALVAMRRPVYILERQVPAELILETYGLAQGAGLSYDTAALLQVMLSIVEQPGPKKMLGLAPSCSNFVALGRAAKGGVPVYGRNLDWGMGEALADLATVSVYEPNVGHRFVAVGWAGVIGCLTAMNEWGLCIGEESVSSPQDTSLEGMPLFLLVRQAIQYCSALTQAQNMIVRTPGTCGYHITVLDGEAREAVTIERTARYWAIRRPRYDVLLGCVDERRKAEYAGGELPNPAISKSDHSSDSRYRRLAGLAGASYGRIDEGLMRGFMGDSVDPRTGQPGTSLHCVANECTLHSVVWKPTELKFWVAQGKPPAPTHGYVGYDLAAMIPGGKPSTRLISPGGPGARPHRLRVR